MLSMRSKIRALVMPAAGLLFLGVTSCGFNNELQDTGSGVHGAVTVPNFRMVQSRIEGVLGNDVSFRNDATANTARGVAEPNSQETTLPDDLSPGAFYSSIQLAHGGCAALIGKAGVMNTKYGINFTGGTVANRSSQLVEFGIRLMEQGTGLARTVDPLLFANLLENFTRQVDELKGMAGTTIQQASNSVCTAAVLACLQLGL